MLFVQGRVIIDVRAEVNSENAHFTCNTNLINFLHTEDSNGVEFSELLVKSYINDDPTIFTSPTKKLMEAALPGRWNMNVFSYSSLRWREFEETTDESTEEPVGDPTGYFVSNISQTTLTFTEEFSELCYANVAVPCPLGNPRECIVMVEMEVLQGA